MSSDIIYESEYLSNTADKQIQCDSDSWVSDSSNSLENENEEHSVIPTALGTEMSFLIGRHSKFGRTSRYNSRFFKNQCFYLYNFFVLHLCIYKK